MPITKPTIHLNGTSRDAIIDMYDEADRLLNKAIRGLEHAAPNARDYYPQGPGAFPQAQREHVARLAKLEEVRKDLQILIEHVAELAPGESRL